MSGGGGGKREMLGTFPKTFLWGAASTYTERGKTEFTYEHQKEFDSTSSSHNGNEKKGMSTMFSKLADRSGSESRAAETLAYTPSGRANTDPFWP